jgi:hypothetical protein
LLLKPRGSDSVADIAHQRLQDISTIFSGGLEVGRGSFNIPARAPEISISRKHPDLKQITRPPAEKSRSSQTRVALEPDFFQKA